MVSQGEVLRGLPYLFLVKLTKTNFNAGAINPAPSRPKNFTTPEPQSQELFLNLHIFFTKIPQFMPARPP